MTDKSKPKGLDLYWWNSEQWVTFQAWVPLEHSLESISVEQCPSSGERPGLAGFPCPAPRLLARKIWAWGISFYTELPNTSLPPR